MFFRLLTTHNSSRFTRPLRCKANFVIHSLKTELFEMIAIMWSPYPWDYVATHVVSNNMLDPWVDMNCLVPWDFCLWSEAVKHWIIEFCANLVRPASLTFRPWKVCIPEGKDRFPTSLFLGRAVKLQGGVVYLSYPFQKLCFFHLCTPAVMMSASWHLGQKTCSERSSPNSAQKPPTPHRDSVNKTDIRRSLSCHGGTAKLGN